MFKQKKNSKKRITEIKKEKKEIKKKIEESSLEKEIDPIGVSSGEETKNLIENNEFREFLQPLQTSAPVLTQVESPSLEINIASSPLIQTKEKETSVGYNPNNEPKYAGVIDTDNLDERKYESEFRPPILGPTESERFREEILTPQKQIGGQEIQDTSRIETHALEQKRKDPFETQEQKYREVKF